MTTELPASIRLAWITDVHLDSADEEAFLYLVKRLQAQEPEGLLISGDIANGASVFHFLKRFREEIGVPIYYVMGNHDFWGKSIREQRMRAEQLMVEDPSITYLTRSGVIQLTPHTALVGHDGWADAKAGNYFLSPLALRDYLYIQELLDLTPEKRHRVLNSLGDEAAHTLGLRLEEALTHFERVLVVTHVPPYREACLYQNHPADDTWAPHFVCQSLGDRLLEVAERWPDRQIRVFCGHSHHEANFSPLPNLRVFVGHAEYHKPTAQDPILLNADEEFA